MDNRLLRKMILEQSKRANVGHIGSALSIIDILAVLYDDVLKVTDSSTEKDRFILSKGHAALALYAVLTLKNILGKGELEKFWVDGTYLGVHPEHTAPGIHFSTGSLGMGLSFGAGAALAARLQGSHRRVFVLLSDAECNEGSLWEAVMFAAHHGLANLTAIIDLNGQQAFGYTKDVIQIDNMKERWQAFRWDVHEVNGHHREEMANLFKQLNYQKGPPHLIIAKTIFGKGVSFMENKIKWHYWPMSDKEYQQALTEVGSQ